MPDGDDLEDHPAERGRLGHGTLEWAAEDGLSESLALRGEERPALPGVVVANAHRTTRPRSARSTRRWWPQSCPSLEQD